MTSKKPESNISLVTVVHIEGLILVKVRNLNCNEGLSKLGDVGARKCVFRRSHEKNATYFILFLSFGTYIYIGGGYLPYYF